MAKYLFVYHGGSAPESEEEGARIMQAWQAWFVGLSNAVVDAGAPVGMSQTVSSGSVSADGGANPATGYGIFEAASDAEAIQMAQGCPIIDDGGTVEIAQIHEM